MLLHVDSVKTATKYLVSFPDPFRINREGSGNETTKYHVLLPTEEACHSFHETKGAAGYAQWIHPKLVEKIYKHVSEGITDTKEIKQALKHIITHCTYTVQNKSLSWWTGHITQQIPISGIMCTRHSEHASCQSWTRKLSN